MTAYDDSPCSKCEKPTHHRTGICQECRMQSCKHCGVPTVSTYGSCKKCISKSEYKRAENLRKRNEGAIA